MSQSTIKFIKTCLAVVLVIMMAVAAGEMIRGGVSPLEKHQKWQRTNLYPADAARLGNILETYIEPMWWVKTREKLFSDPVFMAILSVWVFFAVKPDKYAEKKPGVRGERSRVAAVLLVALAVYSIALDRIPPAVYVDEAVTGYNAYSVLMTGKDEYGQTMPILFKYFGSWLPGLNLYFLALPIRIFGLSEWGIRLPAAVLGVATCLVFYAAVRLKTGRSRAATVGTIFWAVTPWMVFNARLAYEEMLGLALFCAGCTLLWRSIKKPENSVWAMLALSLASYDAHVFRYLMGIIVPVFVVVCRREIRKWPIKTILLATVMTVLIQIPNLAVVLTPVFWVKQQIYEGVQAAKIAADFAGQLLTYFSPITLFQRVADIDQQHLIPGIGLFFWWMVIPAIAGLRGWLGSPGKNKWWLALLIISVIPAALSGKFISAQRALPLLFPMGLLIAEGMDNILPDKGKFKTFALFGLLGYSGLLLFRSYFVLFPGQMQQAWNYGYKELAEEMRRYPDITWVVDNSRNTRNYILPLFYLRYPPKIAQKAMRAEITGDYYYSGKTSDNHYFSQMEFRPIDWKKDGCRKIILAGDGLAISKVQAREHELTEAGRVENRAGEILLAWYMTNPEKKCGGIK